MIGRLSLIVLISILIESVKQTLLRQPKTDDVQQYSSEMKRNDWEDNSLLDGTIKIGQLMEMNKQLSLEQLGMIQKWKKEQEEQEKIVYIRNIDQDQRETNSTMVEPHSSEIKMFDPITIAAIVIVVSLVVAGVAKAVAAIREFLRTKEETKQVDIIKREGFEKLNFKTDIVEMTGLKAKYWDMYVNRLLDTKFMGNDTNKKRSMKHALSNVMFTSGTDGENWEGLHFMYNVNNTESPGQVQYMTFWANYDENIDRYNIFYGGIDVVFKFGDDMIVTETTRSENGGWFATSKLSFSYKTSKITKEQAEYTYQYFKELVLTDMLNTMKAKKKVLEDQLNDQ